VTTVIETYGTALVMIGAVIVYFAVTVPLAMWVGKKIKEMTK
jgi:hypothetical protein